MIIFSHSCTRAGITDPMCKNPFFELVGAKGYPDSYRLAGVENEFDQFRNKHYKKYKDKVEEPQRMTHFRHNYKLGHELP